MTPAWPASRGLELRTSGLRVSVPKLLGHATFQNVNFLKTYLVPIKIKNLFKFNNPPPPPITFCPKLSRKNYPNNCESLSSMVLCRALWFHFSFCSSLNALSVQTSFKIDCVLKEFAQELASVLCNIYNTRGSPITSPIVYCLSNPQVYPFKVNSKLGRNQEFFQRGFLMISGGLIITSQLSTKMLLFLVIIDMFMHCFAFLTLA